MSNPHFPATRSDALARLARFVPYAGDAYASGRNTDPGPGQQTAVSKLSPYVRYRLITEQDVVNAVLERHSLQSAEKYVQEVLWRTYWKGWLEMRPSVWTRYVEERERHREIFPNARAIANAEAGLTGIEGFDDWARELAETGYLHNHARMWFASIWIFTLHLPWVLGADFFMRHLIDADAASNTLSWRWVAGLQTAGKTYLATTDNIARFTNGRFAPKGLAQNAFTIDEAPIPSPRNLPEYTRYNSQTPSVLLVTHEDMNPESLFAYDAAILAAIIVPDIGCLSGVPAAKFVSDAAEDMANRASAYFRCNAAILDRLDADALISAAQAAGASQIVTAFAPIGPVADKLTQLTKILQREGITLVQVRRSWDSRFWPHATKGFFPFKAAIPGILAESGLL